MREKIFVISDIEMGGGDTLDDFTDDAKLVKFIEKIQKAPKDTPVTLILNGDTFDFMKMSYKGTHPTHITEEVSMWKLNTVHGSHSGVFLALKNFLLRPNHKIFFLIGNHDEDLAWPALQERIKNLLGAKDNVFFDYYYKRPDIHIEHGHLYDPFFYLNIKKPFVKYKKQMVLNSPFGVQIFSTRLLKFKLDFPYEERFYPKHMMFDIKPELRKRKNKITRDVILRDVIINPLIHFRDPTRRIPYLRILTHVLRRGKKIMDVSMYLPSTIRSMMKKHPKNKLYVLGHVHLMVEHSYSDNVKVLFTDTWRDEYDLYRNFEKKKKSYAEIVYKNLHVTQARLEVF
jgi:UDP-2,3-diacylglucosamine pyrophosphatase LpxH